MTAVTWTIAATDSARIPKTRLFVSALACALMEVEIMSTVLAYLDPGSSSLLLQAIVGGGAGILVFGKYLWQTVRETVFTRSPSTKSL